MKTKLTSYFILFILLITVVLGSDYYTNTGAIEAMSALNVPSSIMVGDKIYLAYQGNLQDPYILTYDTTTGDVSTPVKIGVNPLTNDSHGPPALFIDSLGYINVFYGSHGGKQNYSKSSLPNDITSWVVQTPPANQTSYPQLFKYGDKVAYFYRKGGTGNPWYYRYSNDDGATWSDGYEILKGTADDYFYSRFEKGQGDSIHVGFIYVDAGGTRFRLFYLYSNTTLAPTVVLDDFDDNNRTHDGATWSWGANTYNVSETEGRIVWTKSNDSRWSTLQLVNKTTTLNLTSYYQACIDYDLNPSLNNISQADDISLVFGNPNGTSSTFTSTKEVLKNVANGTVCIPFGNWGSTNPSNIRTLKITFDSNLTQDIFENISFDNLTVYTAWYSVNGTPYKLPLGINDVNQTDVMVNDFYIVQHPAIQIDSQNHPHLVVTQAPQWNRYVNGNMTQSYLHFNYTTNSWYVYNFSTTTDSLWNNGEIDIRDANTYDVYLTVDPDNASDPRGGSIVKYKSTDAGNTWSFVKTIANRTELGYPFNDPKRVRDTTSSKYRITFNEWTDSFVEYDMKMYLYGDDGFVVQYVPPPPTFCDQNLASIQNLIVYLPIVIVVVIMLFIIMIVVSSFGSERESGFNFQFNDVTKFVMSLIGIVFLIAVGAIGVSSLC